MPNTSTVLGFVAIAAFGAIGCILAVSKKKNAATGKKIAGYKGAWKEDTTDSFTGWLERLKLAIDHELKQDI